MRRSWVLLVLVACGHIGFDAESSISTGDAGSNAIGRWLDVDTGSKFACAIATDHSLWCWGFIPNNPLNHRIQTPAQLAGTWSAVSVASVHASSEDHVCGLQTDGSLWCWGHNTDGALGDGTINDQSAPEHIGSATWSAVTTGDQFTCGIQTDGSLWCWGYNGYGQLGDGTTNEHDSPRQIAGTWIAVAAGDQYVCAVKSDNTLACWGDNSYGALGDDTTTQRLVPTTIAGTGWTAIAASPTDDHTCGIAGSVVKCWGENDDGELGIGSTNQAKTPQVTGLVQAQQVTVGDRHTCAIDSGELWCWGSDAHGELGGAGPATSPVMIGSAATVSAGENQTCFVDATGHLSCTGRNSLGQLGPGISPGEDWVPTQDDTVTTWTSISAGGTHTCGMAGATPMCWGFNSEGEVGDGTEDDRQNPIVPMTGGQTIDGVLAGPHNTFLLTTTNDSLLLGCDWVANANETSPETMALTGWTLETAGEEHSCGLNSSLQLFCRGNDTFGQIGDGNTSGTPANYQLPAIYQTVSAGDDTTCAIRSSGGIECWGDNGDGQVGIGSVMPTLSTPQAVAGVTGGAPQAVTVGYGFACGIAGGELWCWGSASSPCGTLGNGSTTNSAVPVRVGTRTDWTAVTAGGDHACGLTADHVLWCWGCGGEGELGDGGASNASSPKQVGTDTDWAQVSAAVMYTCAIKMDGTRWCFGTDWDGQLGNGRAWHAGFVEIP